jgi:hypothetical protein
MSETIKSLRASDPVVAAARARDEKQFFGQGWSHYPTAFEHTLGGVRYYLHVFNTPNHVQVNWNLRDVGSDRNDYRDDIFLLFALTPEESRGMASSLGVPISGWLDGALAACRGDVTPGVVARDGNVVDLSNFHASRGEG